MKTLSLFLVLLSFSALTNAAGANQRIYTWTDNNGIIHFSDRSAQDKDSDIFNQNDNNSVATLAPKANKWQQDYQENKQTKMEEKKQFDKKNKQKEAYCLQQKRRLALFEGGGRIFNTSVNGERNFYSDDGMAKKIKQLKTKLKKNCR